MKIAHDLIARAHQIPDQKIGNFGSLLKIYSPHLNSISSLIYEKLSIDEQDRFITWLLKRWADIDLVNPIEMLRYKEALRLVQEAPCDRVIVGNKDYKLLDLNIQGYDFKLATYDWNHSIHDVFYNQYEHKHFRVNKGDVIIDAGGFVGDTAALFCSKTEKQCEVHAFEILQENIKLMAHNVQMNGIEDQVIINKFALGSRTGGTIGVQRGVYEGATSVSTSAEEQVPLISIDDYVVAGRLARVDLIKMDIEGSELDALKGAMNTIKLFRPKLAICLYHKIDDPISIPNLIQATGVEYSFNFKWVQLTGGGEAVLLATPSHS